MRDDNILGKMVVKMEVGGFKDIQEVELGDRLDVRIEGEERGATTSFLAYVTGWIVVQFTERTLREHSKMIRFGGTWLVC